MSLSIAMLGGVMEAKPLRYARKLEKGREAPAQKQERLRAVRRRGYQCAVMVWLLVLLAPLSLQAQRYRFKFYSHEYGLKDTEIHCLLQDRTGFLWAGTAGGLFRYDG